MVELKSKEDFNLASRSVVNGFVARISNHEVKGVVQVLTAGWVSDFMRSKHAALANVHTLPVKSKEKGIEIGLRDHHLAIFPSNHGFGYIVSVPGWLQDPSSSH